MTDEFRIEEKMLEEAIRLSGPEGELNYRPIYHLLTTLREMGHRWRSEYRVVLFCNDVEAEYDERYALYLDKRAQREDVVWDEEKGDFQ